jgi:hypothetical protein
VKIIPNGWSSLFSYTEVLFHSVPSTVQETYDVLSQNTEAKSAKNKDTVLIRSPGSSVSIVFDYGLDNWGLISDRVRGSFF